MMHATALLPQRVYGGAFISDGAAMAMARDALAAARADFRAALREEPPQNWGRHKQVPCVVGRVVGHAGGYVRDGQGRGANQQASAQYPRVGPQVGCRAVGLPAGAGVQSAVRAGGMAPSGAPRAAGGGGVARHGQGYARGRGLSWPGAQYMFIVAGARLAIVAAALE